MRSGLDDGTGKRLTLSFDEWNVCYQRRFSERDLEWTEAPRLIEDGYNALDATAVGGLLISLLKHADRVAIACQAQLVNVSATIRSEPDVPAWRQTTFHPFALTSRHARGVALRAAVSSPLVETSRFGPVPQLDAVATHDEEAGELALFCLNRSPDGPLDVSVRLPGRTFSPLEHIVVGGPDRTAVNTLAAPTTVTPRRLDVRPPEGDRLALSLPPASWSLLRLHR